MLIISNIQLFAYSNGTVENNEIEQVEISEEHEIIVNNVDGYKRLVEVATRSMEDRKKQ